MSGPKREKVLVRLLSVLVRCKADGITYQRSGDSLMLNTRQGKRTFLWLAICNARSDGLILIDEGCMNITAEGKSKLRRLLCDHDPYAGQHRELQNSTVKINNQSRSVVENCAESPLSRLYARKQKDGTRFISAEQFQAAEHLRRDFEKAGLQPSITARWQEGVSTGKKSHGAFDSADLSNMAIDARTRLEKALDAIGPELSGVTLDICCFLKGFESVERERRWPRRSAKLMLKTALANLARHYGFIAPQRFSTSNRNTNIDHTGTIGHWGASDYRPQL